nr:hypothetical protein CFP56_59371 [Quercus suber]
MADSIANKKGRQIERGEMYEMEYSHRDGTVVNETEKENIGFIAFDLYVIIEAAIVKVGDGSQHVILDRIGDKHIEPIPLQSYQWCVENTGDGYDVELCRIFPPLDSIEKEEGYQAVHKGEHLSYNEVHGDKSQYEDVHRLGDDATHNIVRHHMQNAESLERKGIIHFYNAAETDLYYMQPLPLQEVKS